MSWRVVRNAVWLSALLITIAAFTFVLIHRLPINVSEARPSPWIRDESGISYTDVAGARCFVGGTHGYMQCIPLKDL